MQSTLKEFIRKDTILFPVYSGGHFTLVTLYLTQDGTVGKAVYTDSLSYTTWAAWRMQKIEGTRVAQRLLSSGIVAEQVHVCVIIPFTLFKVSNSI
jgi:hypothetical protein